MGKVVDLASRLPAPKPDGIGDQETIGSIMRRMRHARGQFGPPGKRRLGSVASRKALRAITDDAGTLESCLVWLRAIVGRDHDPRALAAYIDEYEWFEFSRDDLDAILVLLAAVLAERAKRLPRRKPRAVT